MKNLLDGLRVAGLLICLMLSFQVAAAQQATQVPSNPAARQLTADDASRLTMKGRTLSVEEAARLEEKLAGDPQDLETRFTLIGYYSTRHDESFRLKKREQSLWVIQNIPDSKLLRNNVVFVRLNQHEEGFAEAKKLWLKQLDAYKGNLVVLSNAADFFLLPDKAFAEKLLKQGAAADPNDVQWPRRLGHLYLLQLMNAAGEERRGLAARASEQFEQAYKLADDSGKRFLLIELAKSAFEAGDVERAHTWAVALLSQGATDKKDWNYGNAIHHGHIILGRIALLSGNLGEARQQLIEAGETPGSPQLNSFGPNMTLAKELLEKGERKSVLEYFQLCASFWTNRTELDQWSATVKGGGIPNFGANLAY